jgi:hypothetical protein
MVRYTGLGLAFLLASCALSAQAPQNAQQPRQPLTDEQLWASYYEFIAAVKPYGLPVSREEHERVIKPHIDTRGTNDWYTNTERFVKMGNLEYIWVTMDAYTGEVRSYRHCSAHNALEEKRIRGEAMRLTMSKEDVVKICEGFLSLNTGRKLKQYAVHVSRDTGYWIVVFNRLLNGYHFMANGIMMEYSEEYGLIGYCNQIFSDECDTDLKISEEQAVALAQKQIPLVLEEPIRSIPLEVRKVEKPMIISPTYLKLTPNIQTVPFEELRKSRLSWPVVFHKAPEALGLPVVVVIFIDAITGEYLCQQAIY